MAVNFTIDQWIHGYKTITCNCIPHIMKESLLSYTKI